MASENLVAIAFEGLAQSLRVLAEANMRALGGGLLQVDRAEAVGNIEIGFDSVLNAFHSLYDAIEKQLGAHPVNWYATPQLSTILAIRNARHHNKANRIRTLYTYHAQTERPSQLASYVLVDFPSPEEGADTLELYVSWSDLDTLLSLPQPESRLRAEVCGEIRGYLNSSSFIKYAEYYELPESSLFINATPLVVNAAATIVPHIGDFLRSLSFESEFFADHFTHVKQAVTSEHEVDCGPFSLPE